MKKIIAAVLTLLVAMSMAVTAYADLGQAQFDNWYVTCGPQGFNFKNTRLVDDVGYVPYEDRVEPGYRLYVHSFYSDEHEYTLVIDDDRADNDSYGILNISESDFEKYFIEENETVSKENGKKLAKSVDGTVTSKSGVVLRQGPATTYKDYAVIPYNTKLSYQYTYTYGGYNWGFVTYKDQSGWVSIDFVSKNNSEITTTATVTTTKVAATTDVTSTLQAEQTTDEAPFISVDSSSEDYTQQVIANSDNLASQNDDAQDSFFSNTKNVVIVCCMGAVIIALTAAVVLLLIQKKKANKD